MSCVRLRNCLEDSYNIYRIVSFSRFPLCLFCLPLFLASLLGQKMASGQLRCATNSIIRKNHHVPFYWRQHNEHFSSPLCCALYDAKAKQRFQLLVRSTVLQVMASVTTATAPADGLAAHRVPPPAPPPRAGYPSKYLSGKYQEKVPVKVSVEKSPKTEYLP